MSCEVQRILFSFLSNSFRVNQFSPGHWFQKVLMFGIFIIGWFVLKRLPFVTVRLLELELVEPVVLC